MPVYEYEDVRNGETVELVRSVAERDQVPPHLRRITVPRSLDVVGGRIDPTTAEASVPRALRQLEETMPHHEIARQADFTTQQLKEAWNL